MSNDQKKGRKKDNRNEKSKKQIEKGRREQMGGRRTPEKGPKQLPEIGGWEQRVMKSAAYEAAAEGFDT